jgi:hypothetical protein
MAGSSYLEAKCTGKSLGFDGVVDVLLVLRHLNWLQVVIDQFFAILSDVVQIYGFTRVSPYHSCIQTD